MKIFNLILLLSLLTSCLTVKRIEKNCDKFAKICVVETTTTTTTKDTTIYEKDTVYVDRIIPVPIPGYADSLKILDSINNAQILEIQKLLNLQNISDVTNVLNSIPIKTLKKDVGLISVVAKGKWAVLSLDAFLNDSLIYYHYQDTITSEDSVKIYNAIRNTIIENTVVQPPVKYVSKFSKFTHWYFVLSLLVIIGYIIVRAKSAWIKELIEKIKKE